MIKVMFFVVLAVLISGNVSSARIDRDLVPDAETAIKIASAVLETYLGKEKFQALVAREPLRAIDEGDHWGVTPYPRDEEINRPPPEGTVTIVTGGGDPAVEISKRDGRILDLYFQR